MNKPGTMAVLIGICFILCALVFVSVPVPAPVSDEVKRKIARGHIANLLVACKLFRLHCGRYPTEDEGLGIPLKNPGLSDWNAPFLDRPPVDPWKTPYHYTIVSDSPVVVSAGPDRKLGTVDDIRE